MQKLDLDILFYSLTPASLPHPPFEQTGALFLLLQKRAVKGR